MSHNCSSKVNEFFEHHPESRHVFARILSNRASTFDGNVLVDEHMNPMIQWIFDRIREEVSTETLSLDQSLHYISELSVFARYNAQFLRRAAESIEDSVFELAHELRRNHLEEGGERGKLPAHYVLYSAALINDLDVIVNGHVPSDPTQMLVDLHHVVVNSHCPSTICGAYYSTEGVAIDETLILQSVTARCAALKGLSRDDLPHLNYYYSLHLDPSHEAAADVSVEQGHMEGIARFIREHQRFGLQLPQICDGFLQMTGAMATWWTRLSAERPSSARPAFCQEVSR